MNDDNLLTESIVIGLWRLSKGYKFPFVALLEHIPTLLQKVKEEISKFDSAVPYPPANTNLLCVQIKLPDKEVKVGVLGWLSQSTV